MLRYYVLDDDGEPVACDDVVVWAQWFETADRTVADDTIGPARISTVFLGLDHNHFGSGQPVLWESMIFWNGHDLHHTMARATSRDAALVCHGAMVERVYQALGLNTPLG